MKTSEQQMRCKACGAVSRFVDGLRHLVHHPNCSHLVGVTSDGKVMGYIDTDIDVVDVGILGAGYPEEA